MKIDLSKYNLTLGVRLKKWCSALDFPAEHLFDLRIVQMVVGQR